MPTAAPRSWRSARRGRFRPDFQSHPATPAVSTLSNPPPGLRTAIVLAIVLRTRLTFLFHLNVRRRLFFHARRESLLPDCLHHVVDRGAARVISDEQQVQVFLRFQFSRPFIIDHLNAVKL